MDAAQAVEAIKRRLSLKEVVSRYVALKPAGRGRWKGLCPFHQEKTPSFYVDEEKGLFHCFGCKAGGDLFAFVERIEGLDFMGALERLAEDAGVEIPKAGAPAKRRELLDVLKLSQEYFLEGLKASLEAQEYLQRRGLSPESIARFGLGYAPAKGDGLLTHLSRHGISPEEGLKAGVLAEKDGRFYDRFRNRITFPIKDHLGRIVAFTGRALGEEGFRLQIAAQVHEEARPQALPVEPQGGGHQGMELVEDLEGLQGLEGPPQGPRHLEAGLGFLQGVGLEAREQGEEGEGVLGLPEGLQDGVLGPWAPRGVPGHAQGGLGVLELLFKGFPPGWGGNLEGLLVKGYGPFRLALPPGFLGEKPEGLGSFPLLHGLS